MNNLGKCLECGRTTKSYFCSITCACYSGTFNVRTGWDYNRLDTYIKNKTDKKYD